MIQFCAMAREEEDLSCPPGSQLTFQDQYNRLVPSAGILRDFPACPGYGDLLTMVRGCSGLSPLIIVRLESGCAGLGQPGVIITRHTGRTVHQIGSLRN